MDCFIRFTPNGALPAAIKTKCNAPQELSTCKPQCADRPSSWMFTVIADPVVVATVRTGVPDRIPAISIDWPNRIYSAISGALPVEETDK